MASIVNDPNGHKRILFFDANGNRKPIRLGKIDRKTAETFRVRVEKLATAGKYNTAPDEETCRFVAGLDDVIHARLAAVKLVAPRENTDIGPWLDKYVTRTDLKPSSLRKIKQTKEKLLGFFPTNTSLRHITRDQAADWRQSLEKVLSEASVKTHCGNAKTIFADAKRRRLVTESPFEDLKSGPTPSDVERYVTPDEADKVIEACPSTEWKLLFGLARLAGLRIPSESHLLTWGDVDFAKARLHVRSPKTERHAGHERRMVPITPKLMKLLEDRFAECPEGELRLVTMRGSGHIRRNLDAIITRSCVTPWPALFQTLRSSCEKEWAMTFPQYAVSKWIGHSIHVSGRHYANSVPDELFTKAAQKAAQSAADNPGQARTPKAEATKATSDSPTKTHYSSAGEDATNSAKVEAEGIEPPALPAKHPQNHDVRDEGGAFSGALDEVIGAWPELPADARERIVAIVRAALKR